MQGGSSLGGDFRRHTVFLKPFGILAEIRISEIKPNRTIALIVLGQMQPHCTHYDLVRSVAEIDA
jgi:hypothetical protein